MIEYSISDGLCILRLDNPPLNAITFQMLDELCDSISQANTDDSVRGIVIIGSDRGFSAGADVNIFEGLSGDDEAIRTSRVFQEAFDAVEASDKPVVAALTGKVIGGALELVMACHFRICDPKTRFSMPEVRLGINPGAGGTQRLPRLIGPAEALGMLLTGRSIDAHKARELGLVDTICEFGQFIESAEELIAGGNANKTSLRIDKIGDPNYAAAKKVVAGERDEIIAPRVILRSVRTGLEDSFSAGLLAEQQAFAECMRTLATRNRIYMFFATRKTAHAPALEGVAPRSVSSVAVAGMGSMGTGIAQALMAAGRSVIVCDANEAALERGCRRIRKSLDKQLGSGRISPDKHERTLGLLSTTAAWADLGGADLIIEAVYEDPDVKRAVLAEIESACGSEAIIATNTSTLSLDDLSAGMARPDRLVGLHFFNPAQRMPLVEVIYSDRTDPSVTAAAMSLARSIGKTPVLVRNREGFLVNRLFVPYLNEAFWLLQDGADPAAIDEAMAEFGFAMGPLTLIDMAGIDILAFTDAVLQRAFPHHGGSCPIVQRLVTAGLLGQKSGSGVYRYAPGDYTRHDSPAAREIVEQVRSDAAAERRDVDAEEITDRLVLRMVSEAFHILAEQIAQRESDIDAATVLGIGFPGFRGGILKYARDEGLEKVIDRLEELTEQFGMRFKPCEFLQKMKGK
ncbi:MAG: 3-hydroxyacyl-CoA dehydrogenase NAD-binding domain-containing protein [Phycisphaerae bacterium]|jgi:3-hydroxyacyl-CoA dehydrogenase|nr:3-hydroxyacyl-CoA dehydrogenase NAD-binding domain-containing protein [Phycisphaerae bacterium]